MHAKFSLRTLGLLGLLLALLACKGEAPAPAPHALTDTLGQTLPPHNDPAAQKPQLLVGKTISRQTFDSLHRWDLALEMMKPIMEKSYVEEIPEDSLLSLLSEGQKALYHVWEMNNAVSEGSFATYLFKDYEGHFPQVKAALERFGDSASLQLFEDIEQDFADNQAEIKRMVEAGQIERINKRFDWFAKFDRRFDKSRNGLIDRMEAYIREHPEEFSQIDE